MYINVKNLNIEMCIFGSLLTTLNLPVRGSAYIIIYCTQRGVTAN